MGMGMGWNGIDGGCASAARQFRFKVQFKFSVAVFHIVRCIRGMHIYLSQPEFCILTRNHAKTPQHAIANKKKKKKKSSTTNAFQIESPKLLTAVESDFSYAFPPT